MLANDVFQIGLFLAVVLLLVKPLGWYMARVYEGKPCGLDRVLGPVERLTYRICGVNPAGEMGWQRYALSILAFSFVGFLSLYALMRVQQWLPFNPEQMAAVPPDTAFNTAVSFVTNTNWQAYGGETTMSYLTQMFGLAVQNFLSAATGMAVLAALIRGFARRNCATIGNFWADLTRSTLYILLPLAMILAVLLASQGVVQTLGHYQKAALVDPPRDASGTPTTASDGSPITEQTIAGRPGRVAGGDQGAGHQRRRVLQCQLRAPVREPDAVQQLPGDAGHRADPDVVVLHLWQDSRGIPGRAGQCWRPWSSSLSVY